jgi:hypothetical protein
LALSLSCPILFPLQPCCCNSGSSTIEDYSGLNRFIIPAPWSRVHLILTRNPLPLTIVVPTFFPSCHYSRFPFSFLQWAWCPSCEPIVVRLISDYLIFSKKESPLIM